MTRFLEDLSLAVVGLLFITAMAYALMAANVWPEPRAVGGWQQAMERGE